MHRITTKVGLVCGLAFAGFINSGQAWATTPFIDVPSQEANKGIPEFARQAGIQIIAPGNNLRRVRTNAVKGEPQADIGLAQLLKGTGLEATRSANDVYIVKMAQNAESAPPPSATRAPAPPPNELSGAPQASPRALEEILVTARKRDETMIAVPVVVSAITGTELRQRGITNMDAIARAVPAMIIGDGGSSIQGGNVAIRGIGGADTNPLGDQAVSFNIDGVQIARASVRRMSDMDIAQVEVLKGPQALFYGKNSPAGVISVRSADPTDDFQAGISAGYEFEAQEWRQEGYISGPLSDTLGARLAFYGSRMRGYAESIEPDTSPFAPEHKYAPRNREYAGRLTLKFEPTEAFDARLKLSHSRLTSPSSGTTANFQLVDCPLGTPQPIAFGSVDECRADNHFTGGNLPASFGTKEPRFRDGEPFLKQLQTLGSLEMNYYINDELTLTSVSGFFHTKTNSLGGVASSYNPSTIVGSYYDFKIQEFTQELRLNSNFAGPVNFSIGGLYQDAEGRSGIVAYFNANNPTLLQNIHYWQTGRTYSGFGQLRWNIVPTLELAAGARYSSESKRLPLVKVGTAANPQETPVMPLVDQASFSDFSPEVTLTWRPTERFTLFGAYKHGFLSGGFNTGSGAVRSNLVYDEETVKGFEGGVKALLFGGNLRTNLSVYTYKLAGLQVTSTVNAVPELRNAGGARLSGAEFDFAYLTPLPGLTLRGALAYNHARYTEYVANCYRGQAAPDCSIRLNPSTGQTILAQDLEGTQLLRAPDWTGNLGFNYETPVSANLKIGLSGGVSFTSAYFTDATSKPQGRQPAYQLFDASIRLGSLRESWELALIGRNLTNEYYITRATDGLFTGTVSGGSAATSVVSDTVAVVSRGREVMLRLSLKFW